MEREEFSLTRLCFSFSPLVTARKATEDEQRGINRAGPLKKTGGVVRLLNLTAQANSKKSHHDTRVYTCRLIYSLDATQNKHVGGSSEVRCH